jgi:hypothetical protein
MDPVVPREGGGPGNRHGNLVLWSLDRPPARAMTQ